MHLVRYVSVVCTAIFILAAQTPLPDFTPPTPLFRAVLSNNAAAVQSLLDSGADPNEARFIGAPTLTAALMQQNAEIARILIQKGADIHALDARGATALMWAAAFETPDTAIVEELLKRGAEPNTASKANETALTWAMRRGYTPVVQMLKQHGASDRKMVRDAVERSMAMMEKSAPEFFRVSGCASCHHQSVPQMAMQRVKAKGMQVDQQMWDKQSRSVIAVMKPHNQTMLEGKDNIPDPAISISYYLLGLGAAGYKPDETTEAMAHLVSTRQLPDGSFVYLAARPPMESSGISAATLSIRALQLYGKNPEAQITKAREWLVTAQARTTEERAMKVLGLAWAKASAEELRSAARPLMSDQRSDGGWPQLGALETDAYATGQALVALHEAGQIAPGDDVYNRGAAFLLRTQRPDGSWLVRSRSIPFQMLKESGFPHGKDQWISATGTGWATMALTIALPDEKQLSELF